MLFLCDDDEVEDIAVVLLDIVLLELQKKLMKRRTHVLNGESNGNCIHTLKSFLNCQIIQLTQLSCKCSCHSLKN